MACVLGEVSFPGRLAGRQSVNPLRYGYSYRQLKRERGGSHPHTTRGERRVSSLVLAAIAIGTTLGAVIGFMAPEGIAPPAEPPPAVTQTSETPAPATTGVESPELAEPEATLSVVEARDLSEPAERIGAADPYAPPPDLLEGPIHGPFLPPEMERNEVALQVGPGDTLTALLDESGVGPAERFSLIRAIDAVVDVDRLPLGARLSLTTDGNGKPLDFSYEPVALQLFRGEREADDRWNVWRDEVKLDVEEIAVSGRVKDSLFDSVRAVGERAELAIMLANLFAWNIDFARETRAGDEFRLVVEKRYREGKFFDYGQILSAEYRNQGRRYRAFCFEVENGRRDCFDGEGRSLRRAFLKAPLDFNRISSRFSRARFHPVLHRMKAHEGIDYAAPTGTPTWTVADGVVEIAGRRGGNGIMVQVRHPNGYRTVYLHLSRVARGIRSGVKVKQKQVIGYVGQTGLATGSHLHFGMKIGSHYVDPMKVDLPPGDPVPSRLRGEFFAYRDLMNDRLEAIDALARAASDPQPGTEG